MELEYCHGYSKVRDCFKCWVPGQINAYFRKTDSTIIKVGDIHPRDLNAEALDYFCAKSPSSLFLISSLIVLINSVSSVSPQVPVSHFAAHCRRRLERISQTGAKKGLRKPTIDEVEMAQVGWCNGDVSLGFSALVIYNTI